ncbi:Tex family protein [Desulfoluna spongiiphila]|uniref:Tex family protein n=1 Tax=Desulfoluna spongiiphila TaxID=419481 RepID=UPI00125BFDBE|nr:Tex family protein [Desulfoluna spongiiphila]VVS95484.1 helix-hairpin-helix motif [Desulfoluna spongiiphila]
MDNISIISGRLELKPAQVTETLALLDQGATVPFIARYRKEATGSLDEVAVAEIRDLSAQLKELDARKAAILASLEKNGHLTDELGDRVRSTDSLAALEDIYLPYRPKRRTKGQQAREKGLEPLAEAVFAQTGMDPESRAADFVDEEKGVETPADALAGAMDIMAEWINEQETVRKALRELYAKKSTIACRVATGMEEKGAKFRDYFDWTEPLHDAPSHRILAARRGEREEVLNLTIRPTEEDALQILHTLIITGDGPDSALVRKALEQSYKRLLSRAMETEARLLSKERADQEAITVFADNLRELLLSPPMGARRVLGIDPGFRTGCKVVCLDSQGKLLHNDTIYPNMGEQKDRKAAETIRDLVKRFDMEAVAIGNGTAGRETERFVKGLGLPKELIITLVNESGASIYSASETARQEFPDLDLTVRGAVSIGRRLMDPLSELVKIDPKSIGVGQYQHDVDQTALKKSLDDTVISCVNGVGVDVNRASAELLTYVSGLGPQLARNIVGYRDENGPFQSRKALLKVPRLGPKAFEQCAGFLRIVDGKNPLDASAVHPESYGIVDAMAKDLHADVASLIGRTDLKQALDLSVYATDTVGLPTLSDICHELAKPGRDPRDDFKLFNYREGVETMDDLEEGMRLPGVVTNVTAFGAFVDIGVHQDGLVHISEMSDKFVKNPADVVKVHQKVQVTVIGIDKPRKRISLSMKSRTGEAGTPGNRERVTPQSQPKPKAKRQTKPQNRREEKGRPFNNPFADLLKK